MAFDLAYSDLGKENPVEAGLKTEHSLDALVAEMVTTKEAVHCVLGKHVAAHYLENLQGSVSD